MIGVGSALISLFLVLVCYSLTLTAKRADENLLMICEQNQKIEEEKIIADGKDTYYEVLQQSSYDWHEGTNDYLPFVRYMLGIIVAAYRDFSTRVELLTTKGLSKPDRIREVIRGTTGKITKAQIMEKCPDISHITVQRALAEMMSNNEIIKIGGGRYTSYAWNWENE